MMMGEVSFASLGRGPCYSGLSFRLSRPTMGSSPIGGGFMELHVGSLEETELLRREEGFGTPTNRRWVEDDGDVGDFGDSSMAVVKCAIALSSATSEW